jgi:hypothetical protein
MPEENYLFKLRLGPFIHGTERCRPNTLHFTIIPSFHPSIQTTPSPPLRGKVTKVYTEVFKKALPGDSELEALFKQSSMHLEILRMRDRIFMVASYNNHADAEYALKLSVGRLKILDDATRKQWEEELRWTKNKIFTREVTGDSIPHPQQAHLRTSQAQNKDQISQSATHSNTVQLEPLVAPTTAPQLKAEKANHDQRKAHAHAHAQNKKQSTFAQI